MPPTLDLSGATHSKMIMSPPRINLRRAASYTGEKGPLSSTSSRFNFNHLVFASPPPSPRLPTLVPPPPRRKSSTPRPSRVLKTVFWLIGSLLIFYTTVSKVRRSSAVSWLVPSIHADSGRLKMVGRETLPDFPTPILLKDRQGGARWTVSIPPNHAFPLTVKEYSDMSAQCRKIAHKVDELRHPGKGSLQIPFRLTSSSSLFVDVYEAEEAGLLPGRQGSAVISSQHGLQDDVMVGEVEDSLADRPVCESSLTVVLESADAGIGKTLMTLWTAYGIAKRQGRAFFIDDSRWAYGEYTGIFQPPPDEGCRSPRRHEMLPCPYEARHIVVTSATAQDFLTRFLGSGSFSAGASSARGGFDLARVGYDALFRLNNQDDEYVSGRVAELSRKTRDAADGHSRGGAVGVHVRRGDRHPVEYQYRDSYIPLNIYADRARQSLDHVYNQTHRQGRLSAADRQPVVILASDDPVVFESEEFAGASRAQEQIMLASKTAIQKVNPSKNVMHKFVDETFGWEGGFFAAMFWNLGFPSTGASKAVGAAEGGSGSRSPPSAETLRLRSFIGRAYMMDLAVLSRASDVVVCTVSAMGCRLLAVMMGWDKAVDGGHWVNIDGEYGWDASWS